MRVILNVGLASYLGIQILGQERRRRVPERYYLFRGSRLLAFPADFFQLLGSDEFWLFLVWKPGDFLKNSLALFFVALPPDDVEGAGNFLELFEQTIVFFCYPFLLHLVH